DIELSDVFRFSAVFAFRFDIDLPLSAKTIEVVNEIAAHEGLNRFVNIVERHTLFQHFVPVYFHELLGHIGQESGAETGDFRPLAGSLEKSAQVLGEELDISAGTIFKHEGKTTRSSDTWNR